MLLYDCILLWEIRAQGEEAACGHRVGAEPLPWVACSLLKSLQPSSLNKSSYWVWDRSGLEKNYKRLPWLANKSSCPGNDFGAEEKDAVWSAGEGCSGGQGERRGRGGGGEQGEGEGSRERGAEEPSIPRSAPGVLGMARTCQPAWRAWAPPWRHCCLSWGCPHGSQRPGLGCLLGRAPGWRAVGWRGPRSGSSPAPGSAPGVSPHSPGPQGVRLWGPSGAGWWSAGAERCHRWSGCVPRCPRTRTPCRESHISSCWVAASQASMVNPTRRYGGAGPASRPSWITALLQRRPRSSPLPAPSLLTIYIYFELDHTAWRWRWELGGFLWESMGTKLCSSQSVLSRYWLIRTLAVWMHFPKRPSSLSVLCSRIWETSPFSEIPEWICIWWTGSLATVGPHFRDSAQLCPTRSWQLHVTPTGAE